MLPDGAAPADSIRSAEVLLPAGDLEASLAFFTERLGFRLELIFPADGPQVAVLSGHGVRLRLERGHHGPGGTLCLHVAQPSALPAEQLVAPNGTVVQFEKTKAGLVLPPLMPELVFGRSGAGWQTGRAGMHYRDLIPGRQGGRYIGSLISVDGGPVADYVHFHRLRFQMIYCRRGWVRLVYEDQGPPFVLNAGDCVLQPPGIRHRVLEASPGMEVIEIACPALHETHAEHTIALPTEATRPDRLFGGQRFVRHVAQTAEWTPWRIGGFECRNTGIGAATDGVADARVLRVSGTVQPASSRHDLDLLFFFVLQGSIGLDLEGRRPERLSSGDSVAVPAGIPYGLVAPSEGLELLEVAIPRPLDERQTR